MLRSDKKHGFNITLEKYSEAQKILPKNGQRIIGNTLKTKKIEIKDYSTGKHTEITHEYVVVYQAYNKRIADYAVENQKFGGSDFSYSRMSWIKPNFLWMMYRCGWAEKENQERVIAIWIKKETFEEILQNATFTSFQSDYFETESDWRKTLEHRKTRLQWDPDHNYLGEKIERRAIQLGLKDEILEKFGKEQIECIMDITDFVKEQQAHIDNNHLEKLLIPRERVIEIVDVELRKNIGVEE